MKTKTIHVSLAFTSGPEAKLVETTGAVADQMFDKAAFTNPPVTKPQLEAAFGLFGTSVIAQANGGPLATAEKNKCKNELVELLKQLALFAQLKCANDLATLLSSGFEASSTNTAQSPLEKPAMLEVRNGISTQMLLKTKRIANSLLFEIQYALVTGQTLGEWQNGGFGRKATAMEVNNLTPGAMYAFRIRAIGGSTGSSDWSNVVSGRSL